ncbi:MAG: septum formation initiator family protein [Victivallales bacterium]|jgi:cell division protein FtsB|nr:septum formation initiator family protein [Victivallales bacterium]
MTKLDLLITAIVAIIIFICFFLFVPPVSQIHQLREELLQEQQHHQNLESEVVEYERQIDKIKRNDPEEIERIARDRLGYGREGEEIFQLEVPEKQPVVPSTEEIVTP